MRRDRTQAPDQAASRWPLLPLLFVALVLEDALPYVGWATLRPQPLLLFVAWAGFLLKPPQAAWVGAGCGLLADLLATRYLGLNLLSLALTSYALAWLTSRLLRPTLQTAICAVVLATLLAQGLYGLLGYPLGLRYQWRVLPQLILVQIVVCLLPYLYLRRLLPEEEGPPEPPPQPYMPQAQSQPEEEAPPC